MSNKKSQHYVPQFYLRKFSSDSPKVINLYNIDSEHFIKNATIKHQACKDYFYNTDVNIENAFAYFEEGISHIINKILNDLKLPKENSDEYILLLFFISIQINRTQYAHDEILEAHSKILNSIGKNLKRKINFSNDDWNWIFKRLEIVFKATPYLQDLKMKLILNKTTIPFIFSDNPIVLYNQFLELKGYVELGFASVGIEFFIPLSPRAYLILYDSKIYDVGKCYSNIINITNNTDIYQLNKLQFLSSNNNLYFNNDCDQKYITNLILKNKQYRRTHKINIKKFYSLHGDCDMLFRLQNEPIICDLKLSFIRFTKKSKNYKYETNKTIHTRYNYRL